MNGNGRGVWMVGLTPDEKEVVINLDKDLPNGIGHFVFSPAEARGLAIILIHKSYEAEGRQPQPRPPIDVVPSPYVTPNPPRDPDDDD